MRYLLTSGVLILVAATAQAQFYPGGGYPGGGYGGGFAPGYGGFPGGGFGGMANPGLYGGGLSPFLNLRRGNNLSPAVNYFNFVRPFTGGTYGNAMLPPPVFAGPSGPRFFSNAVSPYSDEEPGRQRIDPNAKPDEDGLVPVEMPPAGHPAGFNNTMGYFGNPNASLGRPTAAGRRR